MMDAGGITGQCGGPSPEDPIAALNVAIVTLARTLAYCRKCAIGTYQERVEVFRRIVYSTPSTTATTEEGLRKKD